MSLESDYPEDITVIRREDWGARPPKIVEDEPLRQLKVPIENIYFNDTASSFCDGFEDCSSMVQSLQESHLGLDWPDITHNFLIGGDGVIYEGRGWDYEPDGIGHEEVEGNVIDIAFIGNYERLRPLPTVVKSAEKLIEHGVKIQKIKSDYKVLWFADFE